jgi:hypothetical protein
MDEQQQKRESYLRWQELAIKQLGYVIDVLLALAGTALGFAIKILMESQAPFLCAAHFLFHGAILILGLSVLAGLVANWTRAMDFRTSRRAAREDMEGKSPEAYYNAAKNYGKSTWGFFHFQAVTLTLGLICLALSLWLAYGSRI